MYWGSNSIENLTRFPIYCAYSGKNPDGGPYDAWNVKILPGGITSDGLDIDYIRASSTSAPLAWSPTHGGVVEKPLWTTTSWVKVRQFVTTTIQPGKRQDRLAWGFLSIFFSGFGVPERALVEAKRYDGTKDESARGIAAVTQAMAEWESIIDKGSLTAFK